jgi:hypothetical protein
MISLTPLNILLEVCAVLVIAVVFIFNIKKELK